MKKQTFLALVVLLFFTFSGASFGYSQFGGSKTAASCCCKGDSCPMKKKDSSGKDSASCENDCDCCKGDSKARISGYMHGSPVYTDSKGCCKCCGAKKDGKTS